MQTPQVREIAVKGADSATDEPGLADLVRVLWRRGLLIVGVTLACAMGAFGVSAIMTRTYEAAVTIMVSPSKMGEGPDLPVAISSFLALMENRTLARAVIEELGLGGPPYRLTPAGFVENNLTVDEIRGTNYLHVRVRLRDADLAAKAASRLVERGVELNTRLNEREDLTTRDFMKQELDETSARMHQLSDALLAYKRDAQVELVKEDTQSLLDQRSHLVQLLVDIEGERAGLAKAEEQLARQPMMLPGVRSSDLESALAEVGRQNTERAQQEAARRAAAQDARRQSGRAEFQSQSRDDLDRLVGVEFGSGVANPVRSILEYQVALSRTKLSSLERQHQELMQGLRIGGNEIAKLRELHQKEMELAKRQMEYELATKIYSDVASRYEQARIRVASKSAQLSVLDPAVVPAGPISPRPFLNALVAAAIAFLLVMVGVLGYEYFPREP